jgi:hypothetical protein
MGSLLAKAFVSGVLIALIPEIGKRLLTVLALVASLSLVCVLRMILLWHARPDTENMAMHSQATFLYVLPSLPMFLLIPVLLRHGVSFWLALGPGCLLTVALCLVTSRFGTSLGIRL